MTPPDYTFAKPDRAMPWLTSGPGALVNCSLPTAGQIDGDRSPNSLSPLYNLSLRSHWGARFQNTSLPVPPGLVPFP